MAGICLPNLVNGQGCAAPSSDEGVTIWGYLQPEFAMKGLGGTDPNTDPTASFQFRRMRIGAMGNIPYDFGYYVLLETSHFLTPDRSGAWILDAFVTYNRFKYATMALGSFKIPFGRELSMPCHGLYTINRSNFVDELTASLDGFNRDLGFMLLGGTDSTFFTYRLALTNGTGLSSVNNDLFNTYAVTARATIQPLPGFYLGASARYGENSPEAEDVEEKDNRFRYGFDAQYSFKNFTVIGEYIHGKDEGSYTEGGGCGGDPVTMLGTNNADGFYLMALYRTNINLEPVYKIERYQTVKSDGGDAPVKKEALGTCQTFGLNYYPNDWTRLQLNYIYRVEGPELSDEIDNDMFLLQVQVRF